MLTTCDVGITLWVTDIALSCAAQLEAHEDTRRQGGPLGRCRRRSLEEQGKREAEQRKFRARPFVKLVVPGQIS